jgi:hypothetical protein
VAVDPGNGISPRNAGIARRASRLDERGVVPAAPGKAGLRIPFDVAGGDSGEWLGRLDVRGRDFY